MLTFILQPYTRVNTENPYPILDLFPDFLMLMGLRKVVVQYRLKSYAHRHARTARAERVECLREARDETVRFTNEARAVHERKPRFKFYLGQMDERPTQRI